jgi:hypothetical protein
MGGMVLASFALPPALRKALDGAPPSLISSAKKVPPVSEIKHVVVLIDPAGISGGPIYGNSVPTEGYSWTTYPELLTAAGVSWKVYQEVDNYGFNVLEYFDQYRSGRRGLRSGRWLSSLRRL